MKWKICIMLVAIIIGAEIAETQRFRRSRGGGSYSYRSHKHSYSKTRKTSGWWRSSRKYRSGQRSSRVNIHQKHARNVGRMGKKVHARQVATGKRQAQPAANHFAHKPAMRPQYIPETVKHRTGVYPVIFHHNSYGYWHNRRFIPLTAHHYTRPAHQNNLLLVVFLLLLVLGLLIVIVVIRAAMIRDKRREKIVAQHRDSRFRSKHPLLQRIYSLQQGQIVTLSDPLTLDYFDKATDFGVEVSEQYNHESFRLFAAHLQNSCDASSTLELSLFVKEVEGDFALYLGMLDHEGTNKSLTRQQWLHLDEAQRQFADGFRANFTLQDQQQVGVDFVQYQFGGFYDVQSLPHNNVALCEYYPQRPPQKFAWQHAIVIWERDWLRCFYCREIHERNLDIF